MARVRHAGWPLRSRQSCLDTGSMEGVPFKGAFTPLGVGEGRSKCGGHGRVGLTEVKLYEEVCAVHTIRERDPLIGVRRVSYPLEPV